MTEVSMETFVKITQTISNKQSFVLDKKGTIYTGTSKEFKNAVFAEYKDGKYFVHKLLTD